MTCSPIESFAIHPCPEIHKAPSHIAWIGFLSFYSSFVSKVKIRCLSHVESILRRLVTGITKTRNGALIFESKLKAFMRYLSYFSGAGNGPIVSATAGHVA